MNIVLVTRIAVTLTFLILAAGGPYAIILLQRFIRHDKAAHDELRDRVKAIEKHLGITPPEKENQ